MSVETKWRMLGFAFFLFLIWYFGGFFVSFFSFYKPVSGPLQHCSSWCSWCYWWSSFWHKQLPVALCFRKGHSRTPQPWCTRGCSQQLLLGKGMGFCCATLPGAVAVGGQAAGAGVSQELSGTGAGPWGALVFWPGQRWICEQKLCQPLAIHGSPPSGKSSCMG